MESSFHSKSINCNEEGEEEIYESLVLGRGEHSGGGGMMMREKEHMFDKVVTPSDVGKLNRLVIPKQYAEKYFPLNSSTNDKGLLLNFEDRNGKPWRFRYSYWNSSQSYVMTKGWSRFVKDKKLDAGDIVSFLRGVGDLGKDHLFIDWRRRPETLLPPPSSVVRGHHQYLSFPHHHPLNHPYYLQQRCRDHSLHLQQMNPHHHQSHLNTYTYGILPFQSPHQLVNTGMGIGMMHMRRRDGGGDEIDEEEEEPMVYESVPVVQGKVVAKRLRLFGVNMDCPISDQSETTILPSTTAAPPPSASSSTSSSSMMPYSYIGTPLLKKMSSDNKGKGSLSFDFDV